MTGIIARTSATAATFSKGAVAICLGISLVFFAGIASAHFLLNLNVRILHVEHIQNGLRVFIRMPMPYLVADKLGVAEGSDLPEPAPFTTNAREGDTLVHFVDQSKIAADSLGLARIVAAGFEFRTGGERLGGLAEQQRLYRVGTEPGFATLEEARASFAADTKTATFERPLYVGDAVVDVVLRYDAQGPVWDFAVSSTLDPGLPGQENTANLILDYTSGGSGVQPSVFRSRGLLQEPVFVGQSQLAAIWTFVREGIRHILEGIDHVLFVVCLVLGAQGLASLLWRVTGFTLGHSVTLALGFFGFVPAGAWFVPAVETGIALSIIFAAAVAILPQRLGQNKEVRTFWLTCFIGLLHGLGFSFVLQNILQVTSPNIWQSLLAFNVGVELGQLSIVLVCWPLFMIIRRLSTPTWRVVRFGVAGLCIAIALGWTAQRGLETFEALV